MNRLCECGCRLPVSKPNNRYLQGHYFSGRIQRMSSNRKRSIAHLGMTESEETKEKIRLVRQAYWSHNFYVSLPARSKETKERDRQAALRKWEDPDYRNSVSRGWIRGRETLTKPEEVVQNILLDYNLPYKRNNGELVIFGFIPDFMSSVGYRSLIEVYGDYFHNYPVGLERDDERERAYNKESYKLLVLWENEIKSMSEDTLALLIIDHHQKSVRSQY